MILFQKFDQSRLNHFTVPSSRLYLCFDVRFSVFYLSVSNTKARFVIFVNKNKKKAYISTTRAILSAAIMSFNEYNARITNLDAEYNNTNIVKCEERVKSVAWSPSACGDIQIAMANKEHKLQLWFINKDKSKTAGPVLQGHTDSVRSVAWSPDGRQIVSASNDKTVRLWSVHEDGSCTAGPVLQGHTSGVWSVAWSPDCKQIASGSWDNTVRLWDAASGQPGLVLEGHTNTVTSVTWSPLACGGKKIASGSWDFTVRLWDAVSGHPGPVLEGHTACTTSVAWSPDGKQIVSGSGDKKLRLWDAASGRSGPVLEGHTSFVMSVAWSPDGKQIVSGCCDKTVRLWDAASSQPGPVLKGHSGPVESVAWSPDGRQIVSGSSDDTVRLWDVEEILTIRKEFPEINYVSRFDETRIVASQFLNPKKVFLFTFKEWNDRINNCFSPRFRNVIFVLMCCKQRLDSKSLDSSSLSRLPINIWLDIFAFLSCSF